MSYPPQPPPPQPPYGGQQPPGPGVPGGMPAYQPPQPPKSNGGKIAGIVIAVILVLGVLFCGGVGLLGWAVYNAIEGAIPDSDRPGGPDNPIAVTEGEAFEIDDFEFAAGWSIAEESGAAGSRWTVEDLEVHNTGEHSDSASVEFTFVRDDVEVGTINCYTRSVAAGRTKAPDCYDTDDLAEGYDEIEVNVRW